MVVKINNLGSSTRSLATKSLACADISSNNSSGKSTSPREIF